MMNPSLFLSNYFFGTNDSVAYSPASQLRDAWLIKFAQSEPYLSSVLASVVSIDKNRAWTITGSERQVNKFVSRFHSFEHGLGWRTFMAKAAQAYYATDIGFVGGVEWENEQLSQVAMIPPQYCQLRTMLPTYTLNTTEEYDLIVTNETGKQGYLNHENLDYIRAVSMPSIIAEYGGLGFCAVSRCVEWAEIMKAIYEHDKEQLLAKAPKGLLLLQGVSQSDWNSAMENRQADLNNTNNDYYGKIKVLASTDATIDAKLLALSQLPANFNLKEFTDLLMYGYSLAFGYPADEFWPLAGGSFGHSREVEMNEQRSSSKGVGNFILDLQEEIQRLLPRSLHFEFSRRDTSGDLAEAALKQSKIDAISSLYDKGQGVISRDEARSMLSEQGVIPNEWTVSDENVTGSDGNANSRMLRDELLDKYRVVTARRTFKNSRIVTYQWPHDKFVTIYDSQAHSVQPVVKPVNYRVKIDDDIVKQAINGYSRN